MRKYGYFRYIALNGEYAKFSVQSGIYHEQPVPICVSQVDGNKVEETIVRITTMDDVANFECTNHAHNLFIEATNK